MHFFIPWIKRCSRQIFRVSEHTVACSLFCSLSNSRINKSILRPVLFHQASGKEKRKDRGGEGGDNSMENFMKLLMGFLFMWNFPEIFPMTHFLLIPFKICSLGFLIFFPFQRQVGSFFRPSVMLILQWYIFHTWALQSILHVGSFPLVSNFSAQSKDRKPGIHFHRKQI